ncbi:hypothetical protein VTI74DRAFT_2076 [Chaetomium olivicolor]
MGLPSIQTSQSLWPTLSTSAWKSTFGQFSAFQILSQTCNTTVKARPRRWLSSSKSSRRHHIGGIALDGEFVPEAYGTPEDGTHVMKPLSIQYHEAGGRPLKLKVYEPAMAARSASAGLFAASPKDGQSSEDHLAVRLLGAHEGPVVVPAGILRMAKPIPDDWLAAVAQTPLGARPTWIASKFSRFRASKKAVLGKGLPTDYMGPEV